MAIDPTTGTDSGSSTNGVQDLVNSISNISNPFGGPSTGKWNIQRCLFQQLSKGIVSKSIVLFYETPGAKGNLKGTIDENYTSKTFLSDVNDKGGRRIARYKYPYKDGQALSDLGRMAESFTFNLKFGGLQYQTRFNDFITNVAKYNGDAQLVHPIRGIIPVKFVDWNFVHTNDEWNFVTIKAVFEEDNSVILKQINKGGGQQQASVSIDQSIRNGLSKLSTYQAAVQSAISDATAILKLPGAIQSALKQRLSSITGAIAGFQAQLAATFSSNSSLNRVNAQAAQVGSNILNINSGTVNNTTTSNNNGTATTSTLPPVFQSGFDPTTDSLISSQLSSFINANQVTTQQAVFTANQIRSTISTAISEAETNLGIYSFDTIYAYRQMAVMVQEITESCVSSVTPEIVNYTLPVPMSLRQIAFANNLDPDRGNDIEALNPYIQSVNRVEAGTVVLVPAS